jgi:hypothetical protein
MLNKLKLYIFNKLLKWHDNYIRTEEQYLAEAKKYRLQVKERIARDFGERCKSQNLSCAVCQAYLALDIIENLYWDDGEDSPTIFNKHVHNE